MEVNNNLEKVEVQNGASSSHFSTLNRLKVLITITNTGELEVHENQFQALFNQFEYLKKYQTDFLQFLVMVRIDLMTKADCLKKIKTSQNLSRSDKSYALVHSFMLNQYMLRLTKLEDLCKKSINEICRAHHSGDAVEALIAKHLEVLVKMKRRMKQMIDVSEKYVVVDMFDTANDMKDLCDEMETRMGVVNKESKLCKSTLSLEDELEEESPGRAVAECMSKTMEAYPERRKKTFRALAEHLIVITKAFTARR